MRKILFRGKRTNNGEWVEGSYVAANHHWHKHGIHRDWIVCNAYANGGWFALGVKYPVITESIGQFTGLTDKNGKKIFEGDILNTSNSNCRIWYVDYKNTAFCSNQGNANYSCVLDDFMLYSSVEVIGNIHDNPELLKGGK